MISIRSRCIHTQRPFLRSVHTVRTALLSLLIIIPIIVAGGGYAPVRSFSRSNYGAGMQNWNLVQDSTGRVYVANGDGMLCFDGQRWLLHRLPNYSTVRSLLCSDASGRIYAGGSGEFGFFAVSPEGEGRFVSIPATFPARYRNFSEIWDIHEFPDGSLAFQGDFMIYITESPDDHGLPPGTVHVVRSREKIVASAVVGDALVYASDDGRLWRYAGGKRVSQLKGCGILHGMRVAGITAAPGGSMIVATASDGLFKYSHGALSPLPTSCDGFLRENRVFCLTSDGHRLALGTVARGAVVLDLPNGEPSFINRDTGLQNNTVLGMAFDHSGNLWLCLDNGLDYALISSRARNLLGESAEYGAGYASLLWNGRLLLGTNQGLFSIPYPTAPLPAPPAPVKELGGQIWGLDTIGGTLFISADEGLFTMRQGETPKKFAGIPGTWSVSRLRGNPGFALASTYRQFHLLRRNAGGEWVAAGPVAGYEEAGGRFIEDGTGAIWLAHWIKGIYRLRLAPGLRSFASVKLFDSADGLPSDRDNSVGILNGRIVVTTASGEFFVPGHDGRMHRDERLCRLLPYRYPSHLHRINDSTSLLISPRYAWVVTERGSGFSIDSLSLRIVPQRIVPGFESVNVMPGHEMIISNQDGFYLASDRRGLHAEEGASRPPYHAFVGRVTAAQDSLLYSFGAPGNGERLTVPWELNSLRFEFSAPEYSQEDAVLFSVMLENYDKEWSMPSPAASKEYTGLHEGRYTLWLRARNQLTGTVSESSFEFRVLPPWYRSGLAMVFYLTLTALGIWTLVRYLRHLAYRQANEMKRRTERELAEMKREQLERDIRHKSSELNNVTMNLTRKNRILLDIDSRLREMKENPVTADHRLGSDIDRLQSMIRHSMSDDNSWRKFHQNFDIVYEDFTRHLLERHPDLTMQERKICCYLKMGMSSKEIAPLFSISPRSMEMSRYRLRKKLGLDHGQNLVEYLQTL